MVAVTVSALLLLGHPAQAVDIYSFFDAQCRRQSGLLVHVDEKRVLFVGLDGQPAALSRLHIRSLVLHRVLENPLVEITPAALLRPQLRRLWTDKSKRPTFTGWVTGFHDDLLIFFDLEGKSHVAQANEIVRIRDFIGSASPTRPARHRAPTLAFPKAIVPCGSPEVPGGAVTMPSRVITDRIKIDDRLTALSDRYRGFAGLEERTLFYARPYHFQPTLRLGLTYAQNAGFAKYFPFYFNYTGGTPYRFQSRILIGSITHDALPFLRRTLAASSDIKSHFFHATFVGQLPALPAESDAFLVDNGESPRHSVATSYNYLILMGLDYWRLSASAGPAYFALRFSGQVDANPGGAPALRDYAFTALATSVSPVFRLQYRADRWIARLLYYRTRLSGVPAEAKLLPGASDASLEVGSDTVRMGVTAQLPLRLTASVDQIFSFSSAEAKAAGASFSVSYFQSETALMIGAEFGRYIAVKAFARFVARSYEQTIDFGSGQPSSETSESSFEPLFGGVLEFVF